MKIHVYSFCWNENPMVKFFLRHYEKFADKIIVYDQDSTDGTLDILKAHPLVELRKQDWSGLDDERFIDLVNSAWIGDSCDWIMWPDIDEILYHPNVFWALATATEDVIRSKGYALISKSGFDGDDGRQIYEQVTTGYPQPNYDKCICWRSGIKLSHSIGRHTYSDSPRTNGVIGEDAKLKLFHCHYIGGVAFTRAKNQRTYERCVKKSYGWNHSPAMQLDSTQVGTVAWVDDLINNNKLFDVL